MGNSLVSGRVSVFFDLGPNGYGKWTALAFPIFPRSQAAPKSAGEACGFQSSGNQPVWSRAGVWWKVKGVSFPKEVRCIHQE